MWIICTLKPKFWQAYHVKCVARKQNTLPRLASQSFCDMHMKKNGFCKPAVSKYILASIEFRCSRIALLLVCVNRSYKHRRKIFNHMIPVWLSTQLYENYFPIHNQKSIQNAIRSEPIQILFGKMDKQNEKRPPLYFVSVCHFVWYLYNEMHKTHLVRWRKSESTQYKLGSAFWFSHGKASEWFENVFVTV